TASGVAAGQGGGGIHCTPVQPFTVESSIVSANVNSLAPDIFSAGTVTANVSAIGSSAGIATFAPDATTTSLLGANLYLGALTNNGGPTQTHLPGGTSPIRDIGSNVAGLTTD